MLPVVFNLRTGASSHNPADIIDNLLALQKMSDVWNEH